MVCVLDVASACMSIVVISAGLGDVLFMLLEGALNYDNIYVIFTSVMCLHVRMRPIPMSRCNDVTSIVIMCLLLAGLSKPFRLRALIGLWLWHRISL